MSQKILITRFSYNLPHEDFKRLLQSVAGEFAQVPGCQWKIWLIDESKNEGGAVYLFDNDDAVQAFENSPLVQSVMAHPALSNFDFRLAGVLVEPGLVTRAPIRETALA